MHFMLSRVRVWVCACVKVRDRNRHKSWCSKGLREGKGERHDLDTIVSAEWENIQGPPIGGTINSRHFFCALRVKEFQGGENTLVSWIWRRGCKMQVVFPKLFVHLWSVLPSFLLPFLYVSLSPSLPSNL